jgi:4-aminobutyrate aminotransferase-like enzyme
MSFSHIMDSNAYRGGEEATHCSPHDNGCSVLRTGCSTTAPCIWSAVRCSHVFDADGVRYLDAYNNVVSGGHGQPHVVDPVARQMSTLNTHSRYLHRGIIDYSEGCWARGRTGSTR